MNVKSFLAGKRGICPHCDARWEVPLESVIPEGAPKMRPGSRQAEGQPQHAAVASDGGAPPASAAGPHTELGDQDHPASDENAPVRGPVKPETSANDDATPQFDVPASPQPDPIDEAPDAVWYVRPASGGEFGPATGDVMRRWMDEGRVGADSMVWREGWSEWQIAGPVFPTLGGGSPTPAPADFHVNTGPDASALADLETIQKKTVDTSGRVARRRAAGRGKSIAAIVILGLMIVTLFVVLILVLPK